MNWYYAVDGRQQGPVSGEIFEQLVREGVIGPTTLVWREGLEQWQRYDEVFGASAVAPARLGTAAIGEGAASAGVVCAECGRSVGEEVSIVLSGRRICAACKAIVLQRLREGVSDQEEAEIRREHLSHEASVKSIGTLYFLGGVLVGLAALGVMSGGPRRGLAVGAVLLGIAAGQLVVATGLSRLRPWARIAAGVFSGVGLLGFPLGTLINGYILYLLFSRKGGVVFSADYQRVIAATPDMKYRTPWLAWVLLVLLLGLIGLGIAAVVWGG